MAKDNDNIGGVWRTISGRRVFIKDGQDLATAMIESGKFKNLRSSYKKAKTDIENEEKEKTFKEVAMATAKAFGAKEVTVKGEKIDLSKEEDNKSIKELNDEMLGDKYKGKGETPSLIYSNDRRIDIANNADGGKTATIWKDGKIERKTNLPDNVKGDKTKEYFDNYLEKLDNQKENNNLQEQNKYETDYNFAKSRHIGFGSFNKDGIPVYDGKIDNKGDFGWADLSKLSDEELRNALNVQSEEYHNAINEKMGDQRTRNGKMDKIFNTAKQQKYEEGMNKLNEEMQKRDLPRYNIYNKENGMIMVSSPTKEMAERQLKKMQETDKSLQKSYGWEKLPEYEIKEGKVDEYLNEVKDEKFVQQSTSPFYPDREYSQEELKRMEENGIKPTKNSYSGSGWEGINSNKNLTTSEQAKAITEEMKKQYPDVKIARKSDVYSGGSSITFSVMSSDKDLYISDKDIDKLGSEQLYNTEITRGYGFERWANDNVPNYRTEHTFSVNDVKKYAKEQLAQLKKGDNQSVRGDEWYLSDYGKKVMTELNKQANSYTYDDSDAMTDYFNHGTYMWVNIGKWDKPYQVNEKSDTPKTTNQIMNDAIRRKSYENYMKKHPSINMTFEDFKNQK